MFLKENKNNATINYLCLLYFQHITSHYPKNDLLEDQFACRLTHVGLHRVGSSAEVRSKAFPTCAHGLTETPKPLTRTREFWQSKSIQDITQWA